MFSRRAFLRQSLLTATQTWLLASGLRANAFYGDAGTAVDRWLRRMTPLHRRLREGDLDPAAWCRAMHALFDEVGLAAMVRGLDLERFIAREMPTGRLAVIQNIPLPQVPGLGPMPAFGHKVFVLKRGGAIIPHAHNDMVSAHLVVKGRFHVRTFNRHFEQETEPGYLALEPSLDRTFGPGEVITMADDQDNVHWMVAQTDLAVTFDIPVTALGSGRRYPHPGNRYSMIFVDPFFGKRGDGLLRGKILDFEGAVSQFAG